MSHAGMNANYAATYSTSHHLNQCVMPSVEAAQELYEKYKEHFPPLVTAEEFIEKHAGDIVKGSFVVNKSKQYLPDIYEVSWVMDNKMRLVGQPFDHVFVKGGFRIAEPKELEVGMRLYC